MAKLKKNKKANADSVYAKKSGVATKSNPFALAKGATSKKLNPFEVHVNKEKFHILGRTCKHDKGMPGVSRGKAAQRRKETLGQEYLDKHKTNRFRDRRIGKYLSGTELTEDVLNARFVAEKISQLKQNKASRFNLNDDEILTHRGQTIAEIEQFQDERSDDDEDLQDEGLDASFTEAAHFGGDNTEGTDRKSAIDEMILEQKKRKLEIAKEKDELHDLTEKLDTNYKDLISLMGKMTKNDMKKQAPDDYDKIMREMIFEPRGAVTDKLLSEDDLAKKEKRHLEMLETERLKRMQGDGEETEVKEKPKHRSADDLDDGYFANGGDEEEGTLAYTLGGELGTKLEKEVNAEVESASDENDDDVIDDKEEEEEEDENEDDVEDNTDSNESEEDDNLSDLKDVDSEEENDIADENTKLKNEKQTETKRSKMDTKNERLDLPFTIEMPNTYEAFMSVLNKYSPDDKALILERLIKCNHPKLEGVNREKVVKLFAYVLQYINELFSVASLDNVQIQFKTLDRLNPLLYDLIHLNPEKMSTILLKVIKEKYEEYRKNPKAYPGLETIVFFKLVSNLFSTSDYRHPVVTPCYTFIQHILSRARVRSRQDIALGLFLVTIVIEFSQLSKRFLTAAFNYLLGIVYLSIPKHPVEVFRILPPFQSTGPMSKLLAIGGDSAINDVSEELLKSEDLVTITLSIDFKIRALNTALKLIKELMNIVSSNIGSNYLADNLLNILERLSIKGYPAFVQKNYDETKEGLQIIASKKLTKLVPPEKKPKALRLLEPRFETVYDDKRRPKLTKEKEEKVKLIHKLRRETKGAVREIRRDTQFLQKMRIRHQIQSDLERKEKVKRIYQEASMQQGELNELSRAKKKRKF